MTMKTFDEVKISIGELKAIFAEAEALVVKKTADEYGKKANEWPPEIKQSIIHYRASSQMNYDVIIALLHGKHQGEFDENAEVQEENTVQD